MVTEARLKAWQKSKVISLAGRCFPGRCLPVNPASGRLRQERSWVQGQAGLHNESWGHPGLHTEISSNQTKLLENTKTSDLYKSQCVLFKTVCQNYFPLYAKKTTSSTQSPETKFSKISLYSQNNYKRGKGVENAKTKQKPPLIVKVCKEDISNSVA